MEVNSLMICSLAFLFVGVTMGQDYGRRKRCPPVCQIFCKYGNVPDSNGCPTCRCKPAPCPGNSKAVVPERRCNELGLETALLSRHRQCDLGHFCSTTTPSEVGKCCFEHVEQPVVPCPGNSRAVVPERRCNGLSLGSPLLPLHQQCRRGTFCSTSSPFRDGKCCVEHSEQPHCPVDYSITICRETVDSCLSNRDCGPLEKCCPRGCGKRCVPAFGARYVPGSVRRPPAI